MERRKVLVFLVFIAAVRTENRFENSLSAHIPQNGNDEDYRVLKKRETPKLDEISEDMEDDETPKLDVISEDTKDDEKPNDETNMQDGVEDKDEEDNTGSPTKNSFSVPSNEKRGAIDNTETGIGEDTEEEEDEEDEDLDIDEMQKKKNRNDVDRIDFPQGKRGPNVVRGPAERPLTFGSKRERKSGVWRGPCKHCKWMRDLTVYWLEKIDPISGDTYVDEKAEWGSIINYRKWSECLLLNSRCIDGARYYDVPHKKKKTNFPLEGPFFEYDFKPIGF